MLNRLRNIFSRKQHEYHYMYHRKLLVEKRPKRGWPVIFSDTFNVTTGNIISGQRNVVITHTYISREYEQ